MQLLKEKTTTQSSFHEWTVEFRSNKTLSHCSALGGFCCYSLTWSGMTCGIWWLKLLIDIAAQWIAQFTDLMTLYLLVLPSQHVLAFWQIIHSILLILVVRLLQDFSRSCVREEDLAKCSVGLEAYLFWMNKTDWLLHFLCSHSFHCNTAYAALKSVNKSITFFFCKCRTLRLPCHCYLLCDAVSWWGRQKTILSCPWGWWPQPSQADADHRPSHWTLKHSYSVIFFVVVTAPWKKRSVLLQKPLVFLYLWDIK